MLAAGLGAPFGNQCSGAVQYSLIKMCNWNFCIFQGQSKILEWSVLLVNTRGQVAKIASKRSNKIYVSITYKILEKLLKILKLSKANIFCLKKNKVYVHAYAFMYICSCVRCARAWLFSQSDAFHYFLPL